MKFLLITIMIFASLTARAHHIEGHEMPDFIACEKIPVMAVLNNNHNGLYWAQPPVDTADVQNCYKDIVKFANVATPEMIQLFENEYAGQIRIFNNDADFAEFMHANGDSNASAEIDTIKFDSKLTVVTPSQPDQLFEGLLQ